MNFAQGLVYNDETLAAVQRLIPVAEGAGLSLPTLALTWVLRRGEVASRRRGPELTADVLAAIDAALGAAPVRAPTLALLAQEGVLHR
jgi:aryl-alcohol dehydrogenase-like predicted oxidoreductase